MHQQYRSISVSSPGKLLISGEYAVLYGAAALAHAINRRARCELNVNSEGDWRLKSDPPHWNETITLRELLVSGRLPVLRSCVHWLSQVSPIPEHIALEMDTVAFFAEQEKLGIGSSAAVLITLYTAFATLVGQPVNIQDMLSVYRSSGGTGSGIDLRTSYYGGCIQLQGQTTTTQEFPKGIYLDTYSVGFSTDSASMVDRFRRGFDEVSTIHQDNFLRAANNVTQSLSSAIKFMAALQHFAQSYRELDTQLKLSIWSEPHEKLYQLASKLGVLYKPSGAGGGDIGIAVSTDSNRLESLRSQVARLAVKRLDLRKEINGVKIEQTT